MLNVFAATGSFSSGKVIAIRWNVNQANIKMRKRIQKEVQKFLLWLASVYQGTRLLCE